MVGETLLPFTINKHLEFSCQNTSYSNVHLSVCPPVFSPVGLPLQSTEKQRTEDSLAVPELKKTSL